MDEKLQFIKDLYKQLENIIGNIDTISDEEKEEALNKVTELLDLEDEYYEVGLGEIYDETIEDIIAMANEIDDTGYEEEIGEDIPEGESFKVFVYGSLKKGFHNNRYLTDSKLIGNFDTEDKFKMFDLGYFPAVVFDNTGYPLRGELYEVDRSTFKNLDSLEGYPHLYDRKIIKLTGGESGYIYFMNNTSLRKGEKEVEPNNGILEWIKKIPNLSKQKGNRNEF